VSLNETSTTNPESPWAQRKAVVSLLALAVILSLNFYRHLLPVLVLNDLILYLLVPMLIILLVFRESPLRYGLSAGRWREGLLWVAGGGVLIAGVARLLWSLPDFRVYYIAYQSVRNPGGNFWIGTGLSGLQMFAWEFLFRGFLLFALAERFGPEAIWIQAVPFALAHFGKPEWETYSSIVGGVLSGWIAYRVRSFYPSWLIHWALAVGVSWLAWHGS
jgi:membrane protease YdiL (CAAX protease family)